MAGEEESEMSRAMSTEGTSYRAAQDVSLPPPRLYFSLPLDAARLLRARHRIRDYLFALPIDPRVIDDVILAIQEAMTNAVRHSGSHDNLEISLSFSGPDLIAEVRDHGKAFDVGTFDPDAMPDVEKPGGRGLFIIAQLMDELELRADVGLELRTVKRRALKTLAPAEREACDLVQAGMHREERQREVLEEIDEGIFALDWQHRFTFVNSAFLRLAGLGSDDLLGNTVWRMFPRISNTAAAGIQRDAMELGIAAQVEYYSPVLDRWLELRAYPSASGITVYVRDIDERKRKELERDHIVATLVEREAVLTSTFEQNAIGIAHLAPDGRLVRVNARLGDLLGRAHSDLVAATLADLSHPADRTLARRHLEAIVTGIGESTTYEQRFLHAGGGTRWVSVALSAVSDDAGMTKLVVAMVAPHDIQELRAARAAAHELERLQSDVEAMIVDVARGRRGGVQALLDAALRTLRSQHGAVLTDSGAGWTVAAVAGLPGTTAGTPIASTEVPPSLTDEAAGPGLVEPKGVRLPQALADLDSYTLVTAAFDGGGQSPLILLVAWPQGTETPSPAHLRFAREVAALMAVARQRHKGG